MWAIIWISISSIIAISYLLRSALPVYVLGQRIMIYFFAVKKASSSRSQPVLRRAGKNISSRVYTSLSWPALFLSGELETEDDGQIPLTHFAMDLAHCNLGRGGSTKVGEGAKSSAG